MYFFHEGHGSSHLACSSIMWSCHFFKMKSNSPSGYEWACVSLLTNRMSLSDAHDFQCYRCSGHECPPRSLGKFPSQDPAPFTMRVHCPHNTQVSWSRVRGQQMPCHPSPGSRYMKKVQMTQVPNIQIHASHLSLSGEAPDTVGQGSVTPVCSYNPLIDECNKMEWSVIQPHTWPLLQTSWIRNSVCEAQDFFIVNSSGDFNAP